MSSKDAKMIRGQIRQIVQEIFPSIFTKEAQDTMIKALSPMIEQGLAAIREQVMNAISANREQSKVVENRLLESANECLKDMNVSFLAWQTLMKEKLELACVVGSEFNEELEARKVAIKEEMKKESASA